MECPNIYPFLQPATSSAQCIQSLCLTPQSPLIGEFHKLLYSLFRHPEGHIAIIQVLSENRHGFERLELLKRAKIRNSGQATKLLRELEESDFITVMYKYGKAERSAIYILTDEYCRFYLHWIDPVKSSILRGDEYEYWIKRANTPSWLSWAGLSFESLCLKHVRKIKDALKIGGVSTQTGYWKTTSSSGKKESEIDLVIDRADQCINLCEIKFCNAPYEITKSYAKDLQTKKEAFRSTTKTRKALFTTLITPYGAVINPTYTSSIDNQVIVDELF